MTEAVLVLLLLIGVAVVTINHYSNKPSAPSWGELTKEETKTEESKENADVA